MTRSETSSLLKGIAESVGALRCMGRATAVRSDFQCNPVALTPFADVLSLNTQALTSSAASCSMGRTVCTSTTWYNHSSESIHITLLGSLDISILCNTAGK